MTRLDLPLHVETHGAPAGADVDTYVLIHGYGASAFTWRYWAGPLARRGHVVLVDLKGFGAAPKPDDGRYAPDDQTELVHRLLLQRDLRRVTLIGHSMGGGIALFLALRLLREQPARLHRLVVVSGAAYEQKLPPFVTFAQRPRLCTFAMRVLGTRRVIGTVLRQIVHDGECVTGSVVEGYAEPLDSAEAVRALIAAALRMVPADLEQKVARYPEIDVPTLLLWGRHDRVVPLSIGERLATELPRARLTVLEKCGHIPPEELPEESLTAVLRFLDETSSPPEGPVSAPA